MNADPPPPRSDSIRVLPDHSPRHRLRETVPVSPGVAARPLRLLRPPRPAEITLMHSLANGPAVVTAGPIGRCCKRGWCRAVLIGAGADGRYKGPALFELTAAGRELIADFEP